PAAAAAAAAASVATGATQTAKPEVVSAPVAEPVKEPEPAVVTPKIQPPTPQWTPKPAFQETKTSRSPAVELVPPQRLDGRLAGGIALLVVGAVIISVWAWQNFSEPSEQRVAATSTPITPSPATGAVKSTDPQTPAPPADAPSQTPATTNTAAP